MRQFAAIARAVLTEGRFRRSLALALLFAVLCGGLSWWQFARRSDTAAENRQITANWHAQPVPVAQLLPSRTAFDPVVRWRPVELSGVYLTDRQVLARNRPLNGRPGFEVLTPLKLTDGTVFVVDRGWVSIGATHDRPDVVPAPPAGRVVVTARLHESEPNLVGRSAPAGEIADVNLPLLAQSLKEPTYTAAYGFVRSESPAPTTAPIPEAQPSADLGTDEGTHLSYALQWIVFALIGFFALGLTVRRDLRDAGDPDVLVADDRAALRRLKRGPTDDEVEDALLERR
ncbi:SURF1 family protein [uncultured Amnibacterium sp.]|uniref:SURF1 family cytochrome oxidase biogenesis protein n=1 Tax=uncultured Amnibacterium sp. TaxID=1631851 RepID=UPI0035C9CC17